jgi:hypothetical protein
MENLNRNLSNKPWITTSLILILITVMGGYLRFRYLAKSDFPLNDGGMFYTMVQDLEQNDFRLPRFTSYNFSDIPYAYPPLSFYTVGAINKFAGVDLITLFRFYPLFFNLLSIPLFYLLAKELTSQNRFVSLAATVFYSILFSSFNWLITGGGLTRSPAHTYFIAALLLYLIYLRTEKNRYYFLSALAAALMVYHHLEYAWFFCFSVVIFTFSKKSFLKRYLSLGLYFCIILVLTSPYWLTIISYHGISTYLLAFSSNGFSYLNTLNQLLIFTLTEEKQSTYINSLAIIGVFFSLAYRKDRKIVFWLLFLLFFASRSFYRFLLFPAAILAALGLDGVRAGIKNGLGSIHLTFPAQNKIPPETISNLIVAFFVIFSFLHPYLVRFYISFSPDPGMTALTKPERQAMDWVKVNTPPQSKFLVLDPASDWFVNQVEEWFPALAQRKSISTVQGTEWLPNTAYYNSFNSNIQLHNCLAKGLQCIQEWSNEQHLSFDYIFITKNDCEENSVNCLGLFTATFNVSDQFKPVYSNKEVVIFEKATTLSQ